MCLHILASASCLNCALLKHLVHRFLLQPWSSLLLMALAPTSMVSAPAVEVLRIKSSMLFFQNLHTEKPRSWKSLLSRIWWLECDHTWQMHLEDMWPDIQRWNRISEPSVHDCAKLRHAASVKCFWFGKILAYTRTRWRLHSRRVPQAQKMNNHEVPSYSNSFANNIFKGIIHWIDTLWDESGMLACNKPTRIHWEGGSVWVKFIFETRGKCQDFIVRFQDDCIPLAINSPFCCASTSITVHHSRSIEDRDIGK